MIEFGFQPFPVPAPFHGELALEVQFEQFVVPTDPGEMLRYEVTGNRRLVLTGSAERMQPYIDAIRELWEKEQT